MIELTVLQGCATIRLTRGLNTLVDSRDYPELAECKWYAHPSHRDACYDRRSSHKTKSRPRMHRVILTAFAGPCPPRMECRHFNGDPLDNRSENLPWGTRSENVMDLVRHGTHGGVDAGNAPREFRAPEGRSGARS
jgi:hypothetical protein